jgi:hypothetical protein
MLGQGTSKANFSHNFPTNPSASAGQFGAHFAPNLKME